MALRLRDQPTWKEFLVNAGIPPREADEYATIFIDNRVTEIVLQDLTNEHMQSLGINILGDILAILRHAKSFTATETPTSPAGAYKPPPATAKLPKIATEMTHPQFRVDWNVYKRITTLPDNQVATHLYSACEEEVQTSLINTNPTCLSLSEDNLLQAIEKIVTKSVNPAVHRMHFQKIIQQETENIQDYLVRLRSSAIDCEFECPSCKTDLSSISIKDQFISGIFNEVLQTDILAKASHLKSLEDVVNHAKAFEGALRDQADLHNTATSHAARISDYQKQKNKPPQKTNQRSQKPLPSCCAGCGSTSHGTRGSHSRSTECPAWGKTCNACNKPNHFSSVCRQGASANSLLVAHVHYDANNDLFTSEPNRIQEILAELTPCRSNTQYPPVQLNIFPDSGANICLAGTGHLPKLGLRPSQLNPCHKRVTAVGGSTLICKGWINVFFSIAGNCTKQPLYFCDKVDRIYFSKQGCMATKILPPFPHPMPSTTVCSVQPIEPTEQATSMIQPQSQSVVRCTTPPPKPTELPYPPTAENIPKLESFILQQFASSAFNNTAPFPAMNSPPAHIHLKPDAVPYARHTPIPVPHHWKTDVKEGLDQDVDRGVISQVPIGTPVTWCSPMVIVTKKNGAPRRTIDFQKLNAQCLRETHHTQSPFLLASQIPPHSKKTVIDAIDGYHAIKLDEDSQPLTTFITEWGRYMYLRMPQGFVASGDAYTRRYDEIIKEIPRKLKIVNDTLLHDTSIENAFYHTWDYLTLCANNGIVANASKFQFCRDTVDFAGLTITPTGVAPSAKTLAAIQDFPVPTNITGARSWFGLINQIAWAYSISPVMEPFRDLIKPNQHFYWDNNLTKVFEESKSKIISMVKDGIRTFDASQQTCLQTDWSRDGIGYLLLQKHCECSLETPVCCKEGWKLIFAGSRFLTPTESRYSPGEGEALALAWSLKHSRMFTLGCKDLIVAVDHKPLLGIFKDRDLDNITNPRLQCLKEATLPWRFRIIHCPGKWQRAPDALSRHPSPNISTEEHSSLAAIFSEEPQESEIIAENVLDEMIQAASINAINNLCSSITLNHVKDAAAADAQYQDLLNAVQQGFPNNRYLTEPAHLREFWEVRHRLSSMDGTILMDKRIVVPRSLRRQILENLHAANQGITGMKARANQTVYWPGMDAQMKNYKNSCADCIKHAPSQPAEPIILTPSPEYPFQRICADYFEINTHSYLSIVDRFSGWTCIYAFKTGEATSTTLINICRNLFIAYGAAEELTSDGEPQLTATKFEEFLQQWGVKHRTSSVSYPQSNGRAELGVKAAKRIIHNNVSPNGALDNDKAAKAILQYRNTPLPHINLSPAQLLFHRQLRDSIPTHPSHYHLHKEWIISAKAREEALAERNHLIVDRYNTSVCELPPLTVGMKVVIQNRDNKNKKWTKTGFITEVLPHRQYRIRMDHSGRITLQNRRFIREFTAIVPPMIPHGVARPLPSPYADRHTELPVPVIPQPTPPASDDTTPATAVLPAAPTAAVTTERQNAEAPVPPKRHRALKALDPFNKPGLHES